VEGQVPSRRSSSEPGDLIRVDHQLDADEVIDLLLVGVQGECADANPVGDQPFRLREVLLHLGARRHHLPQRYSRPLGALLGELARRLTDLARELLGDLPRDLVRDPPNPFAAHHAHQPPAPVRDQAHVDRSAGEELLGLRPIAFHQLVHPGSGVGDSGHDCVPHRVLGRDPAQQQGPGLNDLRQVRHQGADRWRSDRPLEDEDLGERAAVSSSRGRKPPAAMSTCGRGESGRVHRLSTTVPRSATRRKRRSGHSQAHTRGKSRQTRAGCGEVR
jgi:hypothetical protein